MRLASQAGGVGAWILAFALAAGAGLGGLIGIGCLVGANTCPFGDDTPAQTSLDGRALWSRNCAVCHNNDGSGVEDRGPSLVEGERATFSAGVLAQKISRGRPFFGMPRFENVLSEAQIRAVAGYILVLRGASPSPSPEGSAS